MCVLRGAQRIRLKGVHTHTYCICSGVSTPETEGGGAVAAECREYHTTTEEQVRTRGNTGWKGLKLCLRVQVDWESYSVGEP